MNLYLHFIIVIICIFAEYILWKKFLLDKNYLQAMKQILYDTGSLVVAELLLR